MNKLIRDEEENIYRVQRQPSTEYILISVGKNVSHMAEKPGQINIILHLIRCNEKIMVSVTFFGNDV
jgi:hypothetical protein